MITLFSTNCHVCFSTYNQKWELKNSSAEDMLPKQLAFNNQTCLTITLFVKDKNLVIPSAFSFALAGS